MKTEVVAPRIVGREPMIVVGMARSYTMQTRDRIPDLWADFFSANPAIDGVTDDAMYGVSFAADGLGAFRYAVGKAVAAVPETMPDGLCAITLEGGEHVMLGAFGPVSDLPAQFDTLFAEWLPASEWQPRDGAVFERYVPDARSTPGVMAYEIWAPVMRRA